jgi:hypothetical protein
MLPSNVADVDDSRVADELDSEPESEAVADLIVAAGLLAVLVTTIVVLIGPRFGGPVPSLKFWLVLGPFLVLPLSMLCGLLLAPGGVIRGRSGGWRLRVGLGLAGVSAFGGVLLVLNLSTLLAGR